MNSWETFFFAEVGASAALAGLVFVGISINLNKISSYPTLANRALEALLVLLTSLSISSLLLVPNQTLITISIEILTIGLIIWITVTIVDINIWKHTEVKHRRGSILLLLLNQITTIPYIIAGIIIFFNGFVGIYWLVPAILLSFIKAILDAWVLLIEINR
jgi:modulator of FtsH protease